MRYSVSLLDCIHELVRNDDNEDYTWWLWWIGLDNDETFTILQKEPLVAFFPCNIS